MYFEKLNPTTRFVFDRRMSAKDGLDFPLINKTWQRVVKSRGKQTGYRGMGCIQNELRKGKSKWGLFPYSLDIPWKTSLKVYEKRAISNEKQYLYRKILLTKAWDFPFIKWNTYFEILVYLPVYKIYTYQKMFEFSVCYSRLNGV